MDERDCQIIKVLSEEMNITKSAQRLYISQPALTYRVKQIEKKFGVNIVSRSRRGVEFTPEGEYILEYALNMLKKIRETKDYVQNLSENIQGTLRLGVSTNFAHYKLPAILKEFVSRYPEVQINVTTGWSSRIIELVQMEEVQIGIVRGDHQWNDHKILLSEESICIISSEEIVVEDLLNMPRIDYKTDTSLKKVSELWWPHYFKEPPNISMVVDNIEICKEMVKHGLGYAVVPEISLKPSDKLYKKELKINKPLFNRETWLVYREPLLELDLIKAFVDFISIHMESYK